MKKEIPLSVPNLDLSIVDNLRECIETGWVSTGGRFITEFEEKIADYLGVDSAASVQSGTAGLQLALRTLDIGMGDEVIVPTLTFIATVNPIVYQGAAPVFMDCDDTLCMDVGKLQYFLENNCRIESDARVINKNSGRQIKAIMVVHIFGNLAEMETLMKLAARYQLPVIEDAAEALGSAYTTGPYAGRHAGTIGDIGVYSFNANKIITTGGGGMVIAKEITILDRMRYLSLTAKNDPLRFVHDEVGYNYRMLNLQAALGVNQLDRLEGFVGIKKRHYDLYKEQLDGVDGLSLLPFRTDIRANYWFYSLVVDEKQFGLSRDELMDRLIEQGIQCRPVWRLCHKQKAYTEFEHFKIDKALKYEAEILNLPCSTSMTDNDVDYICDKILRSK